MSKKTLIVLILGIPLLAFIAYVELPVLPDALVDGNQNKTQYLLDHIATATSLHAIAITNKDVRAEIGRLLLTSPDRALGRYLAEYVANGWDQRGHFVDCFSLIGTNGCVIVDEWGRKLEVEVLGVARRTDAVVPYFRFCDRWVRVWSCGRDGENAGGLKDDIRFRRNLAPGPMRSFCLYEYEVPAYALNVADYASTSEFKESIRDLYYKVSARAFGVKCRNRQVNFTFEPWWLDVSDNSRCPRYRITAGKAGVTIEVTTHVGVEEFKQISQHEYLCKVDGADMIEAAIDNSASLSEVDELLTLLIASGSRHLLYTSIFD